MIIQSKTLNSVYFSQIRDTCVVEKSTNFLEYYTERLKYS